MPDRMPVRGSRVLRAAKSAHIDLLFIAITQPPEIRLQTTAPLFD